VNAGVDALVTASLLESGQTMADVSRVAAVVAGFGSIAGHDGVARLLFASSLVCWLAVNWFAARVRIDAAVFQRLAEEPEEAWHRVDELLSSAGFRRLRGPRNSVDRRRGSIALWRWQAVALASQCTMLIASAVFETARSL